MTTNNNTLHLLNSMRAELFGARQALLFDDYSDARKCLDGLDEIEHQLRVELGLKKAEKAVELSNEELDTIREIEASIA